MPQFIERAYTAAINRAALTLLAMSVRPDLKSSLVDEISKAVAIRGGRADDRLAKFDLNSVCEEVAEHVTVTLSIVLRARLPGIADEMDEAFGESLRKQLTSMAYLFPTL